MPFISSSIPLTGLQDRRRKLTEEDKAEIIRLYESGLGSLRSLGERFCVSKSTILYIVNPETCSGKGCVCHRYVLCADWL